MINKTTTQLKRDFRNLTLRAIHLARKWRHFKKPNRPLFVLIPSLQTDTSKCEICPDKLTPRESAILVADKA